MPLWLLVIGWLVEVFIMFDFLNRLLGCKYSVGLTVVLLFASRICLTLVIVNFYTVFAYKIFVTFGTTFIIVILFFNGSILKRCFALVLYALISIVGELLGYITVFIINPDLFYSIAGSIIMLSTTYLSFIIFSRLAVMALKKMKTGYSKIHGILIFTEFIIVYIEVLAVSKIIFSVYDGIPFDFAKLSMLIFCNIINILNVIMVFLTAKQLAADAEADANKAAKQQLLNIQKEQYTQMKNRYETIRKVRHDYSNHLQTLYYLLEKGDFNETEKYANQICEKLKN